MLYPQAILMSNLTYKQKSYVQRYRIYAYRYHFGISVQKPDYFPENRKNISLTIILLLFVLGISVGSNPTIINNLGKFGWQAAIIALSATCGSILVSWLVLKYFFRQEGGNK